MATVALTTTHQAHELRADLVVKDLSALSALVTEEGVEITERP
jgi:sugar-phosphatase